MRKYIQDTFSGIYDLDYVNSRLRIGKVHQRIGVSPKLYISALRLLESMIISHITTYLNQHERIDEIEIFIQSVSKLFLFDAQFIFDTYIAALNNQVITAKSQLEIYVDSLEEQVKARTEELEMLSQKDMLTNLFNQRAFYEILHKEISRAERYRRPISLAYFDINNFKQLNDTKGHIEGDHILTYLGNILNETSRENDFACRYGGDEFCIIMPETDNKSAQKLLERLVERFTKEDTKGTSLSIGVVTQGPKEYLSSDDFVKKGDKAMYEAKKKAKLSNPPENIIFAL